MARVAIDRALVEPDLDPVDVPRSEFVARPCQARALAFLPDLLHASRRVVAVGPTGCGKTAIASLIIRAEPAWRVLFVVHRHELADQAYRALRSHGIEAGILMAQEESLHGTRRVDPGARVQVAGIRTAVRRGAMAGVDLIVVDEAHRVLAESYQSIVREHPGARVLGLTATPERADGRGLGEFFRDMYIIAQSRELQASQQLATPRWFGAPANVVAKLIERLRGARISHGDYSPTDLARVVDSRFLLGHIVSESIRIAPGVSKVVFAGSVAHSKQLAGAFIKHGIAALHLDGDVPIARRKAMLALLASGELEAICNYDVLGEGWDFPLGAVILARPFRSRMKYLQVVGRGMRWREGPQPIVVDHGHNAPRFDLWPGDDVSWSLAGRERSGEPLWKQCPGCLEKIPLASNVCPRCGYECLVERLRRERKEVEARLEEQTRAQYLLLRARVEAMAAQKGAPDGWVEEVLRAIG